MVKDEVKHLQHLIRVWGKIVIMVISTGYASESKL